MTIRATPRSGPARPSRSRPRRLATLVVSLGLLLGACAAAETQPPSASGSAESEGRATDGSEPGEATSGTVTSEPVEATPSGAASTDELATATAFWAAMEAEDREAALSLVDPDSTEAAQVVPFGRAETLAGQFDWYEAVGWEWSFDVCEMAATGFVECTVTASNTWSDALGVEPVEGTFRVRTGDAGIIALGVPGDFGSRWVAVAFDPFVNWVEENHPNDAAVMFNDDDVNPEILELYEINSQRFADAQQDG